MFKTTPQPPKSARKFNTVMKNHPYLLYLNYNTMCSLFFAETITQRVDELSAAKIELRLSEEVVQQREIDISCLRGQVSIFKFALF